ncbi:hypothetical protein [Enterococcus cecorum]|uniref:hypothetical protein n=1 Tax=Enterococcus cecorum TaxID=44008 RepID=UPI003F26C0CF
MNETAISALAGSKVIFCSAICLYFCSIFSDIFVEEERMYNLYEFPPLSRILPFTVVVTYLVYKLFYHQIFVPSDNVIENSYMTIAIAFLGLATLFLITVFCFAGSGLKWFLIRTPFFVGIILFHFIFYYFSFDSVHALSTFLFKVV